MSWPSTEYQLEVEVRGSLTSMLSESEVCQRNWTSSKQYTTDASGPAPSTSTPPAGPGSIETASIGAASMSCNGTGLGSTGPEDNGGGSACSGSPEPNVDMRCGRLPRSRRCSSSRQYSACSRS